jgi:hypothetical protein
MPYDEFHWRQFVGRGAVIRDLLGRVQVAKITILLGESGSGKTSLIRAGVVPLLRLGRYLERGEASGAWPTLLLREGGAKREDTVEMNWLQQLQSAIDAMEKWGHQSGQEGALKDAEFFRLCMAEGNAIPSESHFVGMIGTMASRQARRSLSGEPGGRERTDSGLIIVFDQFEEQLRSGPIAQRDAFRLLHGIIVSGAPVCVLLSMRKEYRSELKDLEVLVGELGRNSVYLSRLESPRVVQVIEKVSKIGDIAIEKSVAERIVRWLTAGSSTEEEGPLRNGDEEPSPNEAGGLDGSPGVAPDLLKLQAALVELCRWAARRHERSVSMDLFERFISELDDSGGMKETPSGLEATVGKALSSGGRRGTSGRLESEEQLGERVLGSALERWIETGISRKAPGPERDAVTEGGASGGKSPSYGTLSKLGEEDLRLQVRRIAVRMAPLLSSADYKVQQEETVLFRQTLGEEVAKLPLKDPVRATDVEIIEHFEEGRLHLNWEALGGLNEASEEEKWKVLSGSARGWTAEEAGDRLLACFKETLERLAAANILRSTPVNKAGERKNYWELVHDQFGPNFVKWAANQKGTWEDCESSLVVCRGIQPLAVVRTELAPDDGEEFYEVEGVSWQGCGVMQARLQPLTFRRVRFRDCYLVGTIFDGIDFVGCAFENSKMNGVLFRRCSFRTDVTGRPTTFERCDSNVAILGGTIEGLEFRHCQLNQPAVKYAVMEGSLIYADGSKVIQGLFEKITVVEGRKTEILVDSTSVAAYCLVGSECPPLSVKRIDQEAPNWSLREEFRTPL